jgi:YVTN family beta-propeller protein
MPQRQHPSRFYRLVLLWAALLLAALWAGPPARPADLALAAQPGPAISPSDRVYTADQVSNTVTVIDPSTNEVLGTLPLGDARLDGVFGATYFREINTHGLGFSPDGRLLAAINVTTNSAVLINTVDNTVRETYYLGRAVHEGFISPDGRELWVAVRGLDYVSVVDLELGQETRRITTAPGPSQVIFSPDGRFAYVNHARAAELVAIDVKSYEVVQRLSNLASPFSPNLMVSPDGREIWLTHKDIGKVSVVDARRFRVLAVLETGPITNHVNFVSQPGVEHAYVTVGGNNETLVYRRTGSNPQLLTRIAHSGFEPHGLWPSPDFTRMYVVLEESDAMDVIDTSTHQIIATLAIGQQPQTPVYVPNAVPEGDGRANLTRQGLDKRIEHFNALVEVPGGSAHAVVRELDTLEMIEVDAQGLPPNAPFTVYLANDSFRVPAATFTTDAAGKATALAFTKYFGTFTRVIVGP